MSKETWLYKKIREWVSRLLGWPRPTLSGTPSDTDNNIETLNPAEEPSLSEEASIENKYRKPDNTMEPDKPSPRSDSPESDELNTNNKDARDTNPGERRRGDPSQPRTPRAPHPEREDQGTDQPQPAHQTASKGTSAREAPPRNIGGKRKRTRSKVNQSKSQSDSSKQRLIKIKPELICCEVSHSQQWEIRLVLEDKEHPIAEVRQNGHPLVPTETGEYKLLSFQGDCSVRYSTDREPDIIELFNNTIPLIFKMRKNWRGDGRKVKNITKGYFITIAPNDWEREGHVPVEATRCSDPNFKAHYFLADGSESPSGFKNHKLGLSKSKYTLEGMTIFDNSDMGELFVGKIPCLVVKSGIEWARVGIEGDSSKGGKSFLPTKTTLAEALGDQQGWFFVRVYDGSSTLIDNGHFRHFANLKEIQINGKPHREKLLDLPKTGYPSTEIKFISRDGTNIEPTLISSNTGAICSPQGLMVEPNPDSDHIECLLTSGVAQVEIAIKLSRIWWRLVKENNELEKYCDKPLSMTRQTYQEYADKGYHVQILLPSWIKSICVGFNDKIDRQYRIKQSYDHKIHNVLCVNMTDFVDYTQIDQRLYEEAKLNIQCGDVILNCMRILADPVPAITSFHSEPAEITKGETATLNWTTQNTNTGDVVVIEPEVGPVDTSGSITVKPHQTETYVLKLVNGIEGQQHRHCKVVVHHYPVGEDCIAQVKTPSGGWRSGKGFSLGELSSAGLVAVDISTTGLRVDSRRRSSHQGNIDTIRKLITHA